MDALKEDREFLRGMLDGKRRMMTDLQSALPNKITGSMSPKTSRGSFATLFWKETGGRTLSELLMRLTSEYFPRDKSYTGFVNRKGNTTFNVLVAVDANFCFTFMDAKYFGAAHDQKIYDLSNLRQDYELSGLCFEEFLVAEIGRLCTGKIMTQFKSLSQNTEEAGKFQHLYPGFAKSGGGSLR